MGNAAVLLCIVVGVVGIGILLFIDSRRNMAVKAFMKTAEQAETDVVLLMRPWGGQFHLAQINGQRYGWRSMVVAVLPSEIRLYPFPPQLETYERVLADEVRWFGRPKKYNRYGMNELWIYYERKDGWFRVKIKLNYTEMLDFVRALKQILSAELVTAYRRHRPYIFYGPTDVFPAKQDLYGTWELDPKVDLLLTPLHLVFLQGRQTLKLIALRDIQQIQALHRVDDYDARGLVRFEVDAETTAFAIRHFEEVAELLATAAKRTLEEPVQRKRKKHEDDDEYEEDLESAVWLTANNGSMTE